MDAFEVLAKDGAGRVGRLSTAHGDVTTPALLPVVHPRRWTVPVGVLEDLGVEAVIANAYGMMRSEELGGRAVEAGVHDLLGFDGVVMTDSGTFQAHVYGGVDVTNAEVLRFQAAIGSDIATILDIFSEPHHDEAEAREGADETLARAREAVELMAELRAGSGAGRSDDASRGGGGSEGPEGAIPPPGLALPVQGGVFPALRREAAEAMDGLEGMVYPIGGVVPLMESQRFLDLARVVCAAKGGLGVHRPVHLFGCGHPSLLPLATLLGCDLYDSASYAKYAGDGRYMLPEATLHLSDLVDRAELPCPCPVCAGRTPRELLDEAKAADEAGRDPDADPAAAHSPLAEHNLRVLVAEVRRVRAAIHQGRLFELALARARTHPRLMEATRVLAEDRDRLLALDPVVKASALRHTGPETAFRPEVERYRRRLAERYLAFLHGEGSFGTRAGPAGPGGPRGPTGPSGAGRSGDAPAAAPGPVTAGPVTVGPVVVEVPWTEAIATGRAGPFADPDRDLTEAVARDLTARGALLVYQTPLGPVPWPLTGHYPAGQSVFPRGLEPTETEEMVHHTRAFVERVGRVGRSDDATSPVHVVWRGAESRAEVDKALEARAASVGPDGPHPLAPTWSEAAVSDLPPDDAADLIALAATAAMQFGPKAPRALLGADPAAVELVRSSNTGRVRTIHRGGDHLLSLRAEDGHFTLKAAGARRLHAALAAPRLRVPVTEDSVPFNRDGKSVFAGFVRTGAGDPAPGDPAPDGRGGRGLFDAGLAAAEECLVVDADDALVAVGQTLLSAVEMAAFGRGVAVRVREGIPEGDLRTDR